MLIPDKAWWQTDSYTEEDPIPTDMQQYAGPNDIALARAYPSGGTQAGWGLVHHDPKTGKKGDGFMPRYTAGEFLPRRALYAYPGNGFAFVMRSLRLMSVDIDGKNGGIEHAQTLGNLPYTLAETSKSGNGYHLFYSVDDTWDDELGFDKLPDQIGIVQGVDIRSVGCIYHWSTQRWNTRLITPLPSFLESRITERRQKQQAVAARIASTTESLDETEIMALQADLLEELKRPIAAGKRNTTLFAVGTKLRAAKIPNWEQAIIKRGQDIALDQKEIDQILVNIERYSA